MAILDLQIQWHWVWGLNMQSSYYVMVFHIKADTIPFQRYNKTTGQFMTALNNTFTDDYGIPDLNLPPMPLDDSIHPKNPGIPLIRFQLQFMSPLQSMLVN